MKKYLFLLLLTHSFSILFGQLKNDSLEYRIRPDELRTGELYLTVRNFNYLRNYEFFNRFQDGYTLFGTQLEPQLVYYAHPNLILTAGVHLRKDYGNDGIYKTYPLFSIKYQKGNLALINGVLEGNVAHRYIEPVMDFEKTITDPVEYGTQVVLDNHCLFLDAFVNWKRMIYKPSPVQEQIFAGLSGSLHILESQKLKMSLPFQVLAFHQGGQIDTSPDPLQTLLNTAFGVKLELPLKGFVNQLYTENYFVGYNEMSPTKQQLFSKGHGTYLNAGIGSRYGSLAASYWKGDGFISSAGMPIFQSISQQIDHPGYGEKLRELFFLRYAYQKELIPNLYFDFRVEPVFNLISSGPKSAEFYHSMFLVYKKDFRLFKP